MRICLFEDGKFDQFFPLTCLRPVYTLRAGIEPLFRRARRYFEDPDIAFAARDQVAPLLAEQFRDYPVNIIKKPEGDDVLFLNGRIRDYGDLPKLVRESRLSTSFVHDDQAVAVLFKVEVLNQMPNVATPDMYLNAYRIRESEIPQFPTSATLYERNWEIMADIEHEIQADYEFLQPTMSSGANVLIHQGAYVVNPSKVHFENDVEVFPAAVIDASKGPVFIGANTRIESHAAIYGPCFVGANSTVLAGKITASSIGHTCRVGGEVEESVFHAYVNKYHAGFIGHSYVGQWVNFGAMTTNSDLKNNYSVIRSTVNGKSIDTGSIKVGSFIGDHTKFGIGTLLNTGMTIGVGCNIFGGGLTTDKEIPPFRWGNTDLYKTFGFDKALETAHKAATRRNTQISEREVEMLRRIFDGGLTADGILGF